MAMAPKDQDELRLPMVEESVSIQRRDVETDRIRVRTVVDAEDVLVEEQLHVGQLDVVRESVEREVAEAPAPYREGDTLIIPVVEERLVIEKRLFVVEELRITSTSLEKAVQIPVSLRRTRAIVERDDQDQLAAGSD